MIVNGWPADREKTVPQINAERMFSTAACPLGRHRGRTHHVVAGRLGEESAERDDGREERAVHGDERGEALQVEPVREVGHVERRLASDVGHESAEQSARACYVRGNTPARRLQAVVVHLPVLANDDVVVIIGHLYIAFRDPLSERVQPLGLVPQIGRQHRSLSSTCGRRSWRRTWCMNSSVP